MSGISVDSTRRIGFGQVLAQRAFVFPFVAETVSLLGDQLARVALSVLVFRETGSAGATALTYAATFLPAVLGGFVLGRLGDQLPRRLVMVGIDVVRAALFALMAIPGVSLPLVAGLLVVAVFLGPGFSAAEVSYLAARLDPESFRAGNGLRMVTNQLSQVVGFAVGGFAVAVTSPRGALAVDAATFALSAVVIGIGLSGLDDSVTTPAGDAAPVRGGVLGYIRSRRQLPALIALGMLAGFFVVPEGLAVPVASEMHGGAVRAGLLLAAIPLGAIVGAVGLVRLVPVRERPSVSRAMAVACGVPLLVTAVTTTWTVLFVTWALSGLFGAYQVDNTTEIVRSIADAWRARVAALFGAALVGAQGLALVVFGAVAQWAGARTTISIAGAIGVICALVLISGPLRSSARHRR